MERIKITLGVVYKGKIYYLDYCGPNMFKQNMEIWEKRIIKRIKELEMENEKIMEDRIKELKDENEKIKIISITTIVNDLKYKNEMKQ